jgi:hypothetical protein
VPDRPDDPWLPGETAPTTGVRFLSCNFSGEVEICRHRVTTSFHYETVEGDPYLFRQIRTEEPWWDPHPPALWRPLPRTPSYADLSEARHRAIMDGRGADTRGEWDED